MPLEPQNYSIKLKSQPWRFWDDDWSCSERYQCHLLFKKINSISNMSSLEKRRLEDSTKIVAFVLTEWNFIITLKIHNIVMTNIYFKSTRKYFCLCLPWKELMLSIVLLCCSAFALWTPVRWTLFKERFLYHQTKPCWSVCLLNLMWGEVAKLLCGGIKRLNGIKHWRT